MAVLTFEGIVENGQIRLRDRRDGRRVREGHRGGLSEHPSLDVSDRGVVGQLWL